MHINVERLQSECGINDINDFLKEEKQNDLLEFKGLIYEWNEGVDVEDKIKEYLKDGLTVDDLNDWLDYFGD